MPDIAALIAAARARYSDVVLPWRWPYGGAVVDGDAEPVFVGELLDEDALLTIAAVNDYPLLLEVLEAATEADAFWANGIGWFDGVLPGYSAMDSHDDERMEQLMARVHAAIDAWGKEQR